MCTPSFDRPIIHEDNDDDVDHDVDRSRIDRLCARESCCSSVCFLV